MSSGPCLWRIRTRISTISWKCLRRSHRLLRLHRKSRTWLRPRTKEPFLPDQRSAKSETAHLKRALGRWDLVALFVVAVFNLNVVPSIAANGGGTGWLWITSLLLFFLPPGIARIVRGD